MPEIIIERINERYRWMVKVNGTKYASGLEETVVDAAVTAEACLEEVLNG